MSSSTIEVARNLERFDVVSMKSNCGLAFAALPSALRRKSTCASSWSRTVVANASSRGVSPEIAALLTAST